MPEPYHTSYVQVPPRMPEPCGLCFGTTGVLFLVCLIHTMPAVHRLPLCVLEPRKLQGTSGVGMPEPYHTSYAQVPATHA